MEGGAGQGRFSILGLLAVKLPTVEDLGRGGRRGGVLDLSGSVAVGWGREKLAGGVLDPEKDDGTEGAEERRGGEPG